MDLFKTWIVETPIAHRGIHDKNTPENSISAFSKAIEKGYAIKLGVQIISDGTVVVFNDNSLARMTGNDGYVKYLKKSDLKIIKLVGSKESIPTLAEVLKLVGGKVPLMIEIKNEHKVGDLENGVLKELANYKGEVAIISFNPYSLAHFRKHAPQILRGQMAKFFKKTDTTWLRRFVLKRMLLNKTTSQPNFICYEASALPNRFVKKYKKLPLIAWVVKSNEEYHNIIKYCDNVIFEKFEPEM